MKGTSSNCQSSQSSDQIDQVKVQVDGADVVPAVIRAVADVRDEDELTFEPRLYEVIDPDAIKNCIDSAKTEMELSFEFASCCVSIDSGGEINVSEI